MDFPEATTDPQIKNISNAICQMNAENKLIFNNYTAVSDAEKKKEVWSLLFSCFSWDNTSTVCFSWDNTSTVCFSWDMAYLIHGHICHI